MGRSQSLQHRSARFVWLLFVFVCFPVSVLQMESQSRLKWLKEVKQAKSLALLPIVSAKVKIFMFLV